MSQICLNVPTTIFSEFQEKWDKIMPTSCELLEVPFHKAIAILPTVFQVLEFKQFQTHRFWSSDTHTSMRDFSC